MTPGKAGGGGKTSGSKLIVVATPSLFASVMAWIRLQCPLAEIVVITSCVY